MTNNTKVSIIVTTKNEEKNIGRLMDSIKKQTYQSYEIITVDNNSIDHTKTIARAYGKVYNKEPERSAQRNFGASKALGDYLLFLDADMELTPNVLKQCVVHIRKNIALIIPEYSIGRQYWERVKALERNCYINDKDMELPRLYPKETFLNLGGFDERITGPEIEDLYHRAIQYGTIGRINDFILHHEQISQFHNLIKKKYYYCKSLRRYLRQSKPLAQRQFKFIRPAFTHNWRTFAKNPSLTIGFLILRTGESFAALLGLFMGK